MKEYDVVIIGGGVTGCAVARELSRYRINTALLEKEADVSYGTSKANSGIIHAGFHSKPGSLKAKLCVRGNRMFDRLTEELEVPFKRCGALTAAFSVEQMSTLQRLYQQGIKNNVQYLELIGPERALELEPQLNEDVTGALLAPTAGIIGPYEFCFALAENAVSNGVELYTNAEVSWIDKYGENRFFIGCESGQEVSARFIINAAGLFADNIAGMAGIHTFKIVPRKGEEYLLDKRLGEIVNHIIFPVPTPTSKGMLIIPTVDGPVMVGPTAEDIESKDDFSTTETGLKKVFEHAQQMMPIIRTTDIITSFTGLRPAATGQASPHGDFIISGTDVPGFINAAGIQSPGLTASPAIAEEVVNILLHQGLILETKSTGSREGYDFNPHRKAPVRAHKLLAEEDYDTLDTLIEKRPEYANLVCRCEEVTEAEIVDAIRQGHTTLDSLKFRARAMTGRCQGGFCTHRILKILHRETGIPLEKLTKKGTGSELLLYPLNKGEPRDEK